MSDFAGSTAAMIDYVKNEKPARVLLVTECSMADNVQAETGGVTEFVKPCNLCPHMKRITLPKILRTASSTCARKSSSSRKLAARARASVERMIALG